ncbi:MAG TPA: MBL fold metallo-hydrolase [Gemmatimonadaceae bacterium]|nr:MBL fold metallo-hydrolase [Gemmatimonadaceae bacterium]
MTFPQPLHRRRTLGGWTVHEIQAGGQRLDGGAMFGVVPKPLWERRIAADERNRIQLGMRCLLVEHEIGPVLIDTGAGSKEERKFYDIYGIENAGDGGGEHRTALEAGLAAAGVRPEDVVMVINTHLHFDHAGGNTYADAEGRVRPTFPNARYVVQEGEYHYAMTPNERTSASYFPRNWEPTREAGRLELLRGETEIVPGITGLPTPGHTPHHQSVVLRNGGETLVYLGDLVPTRHHLPLPWIMGYDVEPLTTLETKRRVLGQALAEGWELSFEHDADVAGGRLVFDGKAYGLAPPPGVGDARSIAPQG